MIFGKELKKENVELMKLQDLMLNDTFLLPMPFFCLSPYQQIYFLYPLYFVNFILEKSTKCIFFTRCAFWLSSASKPDFAKI